MRLARSRATVIAVLGTWAAVAWGMLPLWASNGVGARTPPVFPNAACIEDVDRSVDPTFHLDIGLFREDTSITDDEPPDSRRFQFFLVCEDVHIDLLDLPNWITAAEARDALARESIDAMPPDDDILERRDDLRNCVFPMHDVDARIPITCDATASGLDFDTTAIPAGNYVVRGYTYEPPLNLWSTRRGVVRIYDDLTDAPPSVGLRTPVLDGRQLRPGSPFPIRGCAASTCDAQLQVASLIELGRGEDTWQTFATVGEGAFEVAFDPGPEFVGQPLLFRAVANPDNETPWVDYADGTALVFSDDDPSDEPLGEPHEICEFFDDVEPDVRAVLGELTCDDEPDAAPESSNGAGCACSASEMGQHATVGWLLVVVPIVRRRRRRRSQRCFAAR